MLYCKVFGKEKTYVYLLIREYEDRDGGDNLIVRVEIEENPEVFCEWRLPDVFCYKSYGFSEDEIFEIKEFIRDNEMIMWDDFRKEKEAKSTNA